ncbi:MAG: hypothetical protein ACXWCP_15760, partial [Burkholderiales bacterium]
MARRSASGTEWLDHLPRYYSAADFRKEDFPLSPLTGRFFVCGKRLRYELAGMTMRARRINIPPATR